ncbi:CD225/dispanin family protein [Rhodococcus opacus]|uniref:CD225/dispanin family protein n=1 Tax=Rhodococcus opacus TaxID=37919 RepID=UPI001FF4678A|nr:CD225/dispanin family protein [Rhodococcus opacus]UOT03603.1 CD225/dispanin family protein [Rhodococcus opacus]
MGRRGHDVLLAPRVLRIQRRTQSVPRWYSGDLDGARAASSRARMLGIIALCLGGLLTGWCLITAFQT